MRIRPAIRLAIACPALAIGLALAIPAAASATTTATPTAHFMKGAGGTSVIRPAVPRISNVKLFSGSGETGAEINYQCDQGFDYTATNGAVFLNPTKSVINNCEFRVFLQYANGTSNCVNPHTTRNIVDARFQDPDGLMIGNSTASC
jgi:hypothetical protein